MVVNSLIALIYLFIWLNVDITLVLTMMHLSLTDFPHINNDIKYIKMKRSTQNYDIIWILFMMQYIFFI